MSVVAIGRYQYSHYHRLSDDCRLMTCNHAGANVDYFTLVVRAAGLIATPYIREISDEISDKDYADALANGTADVGWALKRQDPKLLSKVFFTQPVTGVTYGYVAKEDHTEIRDSFIMVFFNPWTIIFGVLVIAVNIINILHNVVDIIKENEGANPARKSFIMKAIVLYKANADLRLRSVTISSRILLSFFFLAALLFSQFFQSSITSVLMSDKIRGYDVTSFSKLLDKLEFDGYNSLIWPRFRLQTYCKEQECERWNRLKETRTILAPDTSDDYFARLAQEPNTLGFTAIGDELLRGDVIVYDRHIRQLFIDDKMLSRQPFSFMISRKRRDLVEKFNRAIAWTSPIYPRIMARYISPYGVYSTRIMNNEMTPLKLSNFDSVWQFFAVCVGIIVVVFIFELFIGKLLHQAR